MKGYGDQRVDQKMLDRALRRGCLLPKIWGLGGKKLNQSLVNKYSSQLTKGDSISANCL